MTPLDSPLSEKTAHQYLGLAPFLRASIAGQDMRLVASEIFGHIDRTDAGAEALMNLAIAVQCLSQKELGLSLQRQALALQRTYVLPARIQPTRLRLLLLVTEGSIQSHTPLECLLEETDIEIIFHYVIASAPSVRQLPDHDVLFVAIADSDENQTLLRKLEPLLADWARPVLNAPQYLRHTVRDVASELLRPIQQLRVPPTVRVGRAELTAMAAGQGSVSALVAGADFPIIVRPVSSQGGVDLQRVSDLQALSDYLKRVSALEFFVAPFVDYSGADGHFRKIRIALIRGVPYVCHMAVSSDWMVHYVNAGMYQEPWKRQEEAAFMQNFDQFVARHRGAFNGIAARMQLDYLVMDCAETRDGDLLLFEIDSGGVVHAMDVESVFPYKNGHVEKARTAFCQLLYGLCEPIAA